MWRPNLSKARPLYRGVVVALQQDIINGALTAGQRLPTHRQLAHELGVTVGTITKAFTEAERMGLLVSRVGRGSYVLQFPEEAAAADREARGQIDLSVNTVTIEPFNTSLNKALGALSRRKSLYSLLEYHPVPGLLRHRAAGAKWLRIRGIEAQPDSIIVCNGSQEGLMATLAAVTKPGDAVLTEQLNYAGVKRLADLFRLDIRGVPTDAFGLRPDMVRAAAKDISVGAILCSPTLHNPTNAIMPLDRRKEILAIAAGLGAYVIEDDSGGHLSGDETPTMASLDKNRCIYLCGMSKSVAPGLRVGYLHGPAATMSRLHEGVCATSWTSPSLMGEIASVLIEERVAERFVAWHRKEATERGAIATEIFGRADIVPPRPTYHLWLELPAPWRAGEFAAQARLRGALVSPADVFAVDRSPAPHAVRISLGGVVGRARLADGLRAVAQTLAARPSLPLAV